MVTHVFDQESPWLGRDAVFGVRDSIIASMNDGDCRFDLVLEQAWGSGEQPQAVG